MKIKEIVLTACGTLLLGWYVIKELAGRCRRETARWAISVLDAAQRANAEDGEHESRAAQVMRETMIKRRIEGLTSFTPIDVASSPDGSRVLVVMNERHFCDILSLAEAGLLRDC